MTVSFLPFLCVVAALFSKSSSSSPSSFYWVLCLPHLLFVIVSSPPPRLLPSGKLGFNCVWGDVSFLRRRQALSRHTPRRSSSPSSPFLELIKVSLSSRRSLSSPPSSLFCESTVTVITTIDNLFLISLRVF